MVAVNEGKADIVEALLQIPGKLKHNNSVVQSGKTYFTWHTGHLIYFTGKKSWLKPPVYYMSVLFVTRYLGHLKIY